MTRVIEHFFREPANSLWKWALLHPERGYELEHAVSRARIDGWTVDDSSVLYRLVCEKFSAPFVSTMAPLARDKVEARPEVVLRFLYRNGLTQLSQKLVIA